MQVSSTKLTVLRVALVVGLLLTLFWGLGSVFFPQQTHESLTKEPFTPAFNAASMITGGLVLSWSVAVLIVLRDIPRNLGLILALIALSAIMFVVGVYNDTMVNPKEATSLSWGTSILSLVLAIVMAVAYPRELASR